MYTLESCPNCELLKEYLNKRGIQFVEQDMSTPAALTELRVNGVFVREAPVLQVGTSFLTSPDLCIAGKVREDRLTPLFTSR